ncbi:sodium-dependent multivitamin transporter [Biomphalaria glabrata]|nr:sodium-dependent multivitamin transporter [Biomphalaria glabrata]
MKAVIWTDVFQSFIMLAGILSIVIQGTLKVGSLSNVWDINNKWERIKFFNFDTDPRVRHTFWNMVIGSALAWFGTYGISQASVQRYSSLPTLNNARISILLNMIGVFVLVTLTCIAGLVLFAYYAAQQCDPLGQKLVDNANQLVPYFVMETLGYPGIPGLFIACLFSGALSSVSSSLNALGAITWEDILKPRFDKSLTEYQKTIVTKITVCIYGCLAIGVSFVAQLLEGHVLQAAASLIGSASGPLTGMFILGAFFPWANSYGVITGAFAGLGLSFWLAIGSYVNGIHLPKKPFPKGTCPVFFNHDSNYATSTMSYLANTTLTTASYVSTQFIPNTQRTGLDGFYAISYQWFTPLGVITAVVVGLLVSLITGPNSLSDVPTKYQIPLVSRLCCCCPRSWQHWLNCKRDFKQPEEIRCEEKDKEIIVEDPKIKAISDGVVNKAFIPDNGTVVPVVDKLLNGQIALKVQDEELNFDSNDLKSSVRSQEQETQFVHYETERTAPVIPTPRMRAAPLREPSDSDVINERL